MGLYHSYHAPILNVKGPKYIDKQYNLVIIANIRNKSSALQQLTCDNLPQVTRFPNSELLRKLTISVIFLI